MGFLDSFARGFDSLARGMESIFDGAASMFDNRPFSERFKERRFAPRPPNWSEYGKPLDWSMLGQWKHTGLGASSHGHAIWERAARNWDVAAARWRQHGNEDAAKMAEEAAADCREAAEMMRGNHRK